MKIVFTILLFLLVQADVPFQSEFFSGGEGRSFSCFIQMAFRKHEKIILTNEGKEAWMLFDDVDFLMTNVPADALYFQAYWSRK